MKKEVKNTKSKGNGVVGVLGHLRRGRAGGWVLGGRAREMLDLSLLYLLLVGFFKVGLVNGADGRGGGGGGPRAVQRVADVILCP